MAKKKLKQTQFVFVSEPGVSCLVLHGGDVLYVNFFYPYARIICRGNVVILPVLFNNYLHSFGGMACFADTHDFVL
jgi:hypothetical protein